MRSCNVRNDDLTELHDFGRVLKHEVRDRAIRELFDRFTGAAPSDESLRRPLSSADAEAIQDVVVAVVNAAIGRFLYFMDPPARKWVVTAQNLIYSALLLPALPS
jgi:hypothetical protein